MALSSRERVLYARHLLLPEIGSSGQELLCATRVKVPVDADGGAVSVALDYLERAGVQVAVDESATSSKAIGEPSGRAIDLTIASSADVQNLAGAPELTHAAAALCGAFAATEAIKQTLGRGTPAAFPALLRFLSEDP